jgi:hypothetical protein
VWLTANKSIYPRLLVLKVTEKSREKYILKPFVTFRHVVWVKIQSRLRWESHAVHIETREMHTEFLAVKLEARYHKEDQGVDGRIILK